MLITVVVSGLCIHLVREVDRFKSWIKSCIDNKILISREHDTHPGHCCFYPKDHHDPVGLLGYWIERRAVEVDVAIGYDL